MEQLLGDDFCEFGVYSHLDNVESFDGTIKNGMYYIKNIRNCPWYIFRNVDSFYNGFTLKFMIEKGAQMDIEAQLLPRRYLSKEHFRPFIDFVYSQAQSQPQSKGLEKLMTNSLIGCFNKMTSRKQTVQIVTEEKELSFLYFQSRAKSPSSQFVYREEEDNVWTKFALYFETAETDLPETNRPIYSNIIERSHLLMYHLIAIGSQGIKANFCLAKTDNVVFRERYGLFNYGTTIQQTLEGLDWIKDEKTDREMVQKFAVKKWQPLKVVDYSFNVDQWRSITDEQINDLDWVRQAGWFIIDGVAGAGKSTLIRNLKERGFEVEMCSTTNQSAQEIGGVTIHRLLGWNGDNYTRNRISGYYFCDEFSMLDSKLIKKLADLKNSNPDFVMILSGDFEQIQPVADRVDGCVYDYESSQQFMRLFNFQRYTMTEFRRCPEIKPWVEKLYQGEDLRLSFASENSLVNIVRTNQLRHYLNRKISLYMAEGKDSIWAYGHEYDEPDCLIFEGLPVLCYSTCKKLGVFNGKWYRVVEFTPEEVSLQNGDEQPLIITTGLFCKNFCAGYAFTVEAIQGKTIREKYTIHQWTGTIDNRRHEYTAITRASKVEHINIRNDFDKCKLSQEEFNKFTKKTTTKPSFPEIRSVVSHIRQILRGVSVDNGYCLLKTGMDYNDLMKHLFITPATTWELVDIDHITPLKGMSEEELMRANHYSNLRLIFSTLNKSKKNIL